MKKLLKAFLSLIKRNKLELCLSAGIFFGSMLIGILILKLDPSVFNNDLVGTYIKGSDSFSIIKNNLTVSLSLIAGNLFLGLTTIIRLFYNGLFSGMMLEIHSNNFSIYTILVKTLFHGIFELPGVVICGGIGLKTLTISIKAINRKKIEFKVDIIDSLVLFVFSVILIIIAGVIEGNIITLL